MRILVIAMLLKKLIKNLPEEKKNIKVKGLSINSKKTQKGFIFFAIRGTRLNGEKFIDNAVNNGASVVACSKNCQYKNKNIFVIKTSDVRGLLAKISSKFYYKKPKNIIAVTGTNGKTSVADLYYQILSLNNIPVASIGTLGTKFKGKIVNSELTSPDTISLHQTLSKLKEKKIDNVIIEASSHGLHQKRIDNLNLKAGVFTNFSQDHLDYHKTMKSYLNSKLLLFKKILSKNKFVIVDETIKEFKIIQKISKKKNFHLKSITPIKRKIENNKELNLNEFQLKNLSMAIIAAKISNIKEKQIFKCLRKLKSVNGRLELVKIFKNNIKVYVDFAHTPDALLKSLQALKKLNKRNVSVVFGCGGDRDFKKRSKMAKIVSSICKKIYVTDDNPRNEKPSKIRNEIVKYIKNKNCFNISDRSKAVKTAILNAEPNEIILIAGKGHETKQIFKNKIIFISDKKIINKLKLNLKKISNKDTLYKQNKKILKEIVKTKKIKNFHGISIDTRSLKSGNLFLTIEGKNQDGIKYIPNAMKKGAQHIISSRSPKKFKMKTIKIKNEEKFLNNFAFKKRDASDAKIIAITGSAGKTSLKNLIKDLLTNYGKTFCSPKSYNNHYGVPLSLSQLEPSHRYGIFEVGMSKAGEINKLSKLIRPHIGIITNVGEAHIENFKNLKGIASAKAELINNIKIDGTIILNRDDKFFNYLKRISQSRNLKIVSFGVSKKSDISLVSNRERDSFLIKTKDEIIPLEIKNINVYNVLSSIALLKELNLNPKKIIKYYKTYQPSEGRGRIYEINRYNKKFKLIDESYNANPLSVKNAIKNFSSIKKNKFKKYLLLGDMLELGKRSKILHKNLSKVINNSDIDKVFIKGSKTLTTYKNINRVKRGNIFQQEEDIDFTLNNIIANNDYLMIKGSNATGLNNLSKRIIKGN